MEYIRFFEELSMKDVPLVGGKNASLGYMVSQLQQFGIQVPQGFAITADAYWYVLEYNKIIPELKSLMAHLKKSNDENLQTIGAQVRSLIASAILPKDLEQQIAQAYKILSDRYKHKNVDVAVRSSATAEDLPTASFAGQQDTYLNIKGKKALFKAVKKGLASLFTDRAIIYRQEKGFDHFKVALSVGVQKMVRSDKGVSGVAFSLDTETGFPDVVMINASYGLGETIVQGIVTPDEYMVHKPTLKEGFLPLIKKQLGDKKKALIYAPKGDKATRMIAIPKQKQHAFALTEEEIFALARMVIIIEEQYSKNAGTLKPMDVEWAKDGIDGTLYIVQARPETVHRAHNEHKTIIRYNIKDKNKKPLLTGLSIGQHMVSGKVHIVNNVSQINQVPDGAILVTSMTDPDWVPVMKRVAAIVTERGGRTCHAAIVSRELGIPALIGVNDARQTLHNGQHITLDCTQGDIGFIYDGAIAYEKEEIQVGSLPKSPVPLLVNMADPSQAFNTSFLPVDGVGLARIEFIITNAIKIHPMALLQPHNVSARIRKQIATITAAYADNKTFFIDVLAHHIGMIAAAFYPRPVIVRLSDFKTNEYKQLIGGTSFEHEEENPMLGFRGASRYYHEQYKDAFALECAALKKARDVMGLRNIKILVPFVRTIKEAEQVIASMHAQGLRRGEYGLEILMMCELPSNIILIQQFARYFDGFSIGSNDLAQLTLGIDRDSELLSPLFDERDAAVKQMLVMAIEGAHSAHKYIGICGQAPSDYPEIARFLINHNIDSISLNADSVIPFLMNV